MEENKTKLTPQKKQKIKRITSLVLIAALLITGAFAFLTATDSKTNVFTIGNVDLKLYEDDQYLPAAERDGEYDWFDHSDGTVANDENNNDIPDFAEKILPGQTIEKTPYVENTGSNEAWTYVVVGIPTATRADILAAADGHSALSGATKEIKVKAYAVQDNYNGANTASAVWTAFNPDIDGSATAAADTSDRHEIFTFGSLVSDTYQPYNVSSPVSGALGTGWTQIGSVLESSDGLNYYVFAYDNKLPAEDVASTTAVVEDQTTPIFTHVALIDVIGEQDSPSNSIVVAYFAPTQSGSGSGTGAGEALLGVQIPAAPAGYELVHYDEVTPGSSIGDLYWDDTLAKDGSTFEWAFVNSPNKLAYSGMSVSESISLIPQYTSAVTSEILDADYSWLSFSPVFEEGKIVSCTMYGYDTSSPGYTNWLHSAAGLAGTVVVPSYITFTLSRVSGGASYEYQVECNEYLVGFSPDPPSSVETINFTSENAIEGTYVVPCKVAGGDLTQIASVICLPDTISKIGTFYGTSVLQEINIPFGCKSIGSLTQVSGFNNHAQLRKVSLPNSLTSIGMRAFANTALDEIIIPESVEIIGNSPFLNCKFTKIIVKTNKVKLYNSSGNEIENTLSSTFFDASTVNKYVTKIYSNEWYCKYAPVSGAATGIEIVLSKNTQRISPYLLRETTVNNYDISIKFCGSQEEFLNILIANSATVGDYLNNSPDQYNYIINHVTFNYTDPYGLS